MEAKLRQDRNGVRTAADVDRKYSRVPSKVEELSEEYKVDSSLSHTSTNPVENRAITRAIDSKVTKVAGKGLSTNDFDDDYKVAIDPVIYDISEYKVENLTILRSSCIEKNKRVCINFIGTLSIAANTTTTIFNLPSELKPLTTKDFIAFGQTSNNDGYIGYGFITNEGLMQVRFNTAITSYIRFSLTYDKEV